MIKLIYKDKYIFEVDANNLYEAIGFIKHGVKKKFKLEPEDREIIKEILYARIDDTKFKFIKEEVTHDENINLNEKLENG